MAGIFCGSICAVAVSPVRALLFSLLVAALMIESGKLHLKILKLDFPAARFFSSRGVFASILMAAFFLAGVLLIDIYLRPPVPENHIVHFISDQKITAEGIVSENPEESPEKTDLVVSVTRMIQDKKYLPATGNVLLTIRGENPFRYGDFIRFHARLKLPRNFHNPGGFDYAKHLRLRGILARGFLNDATSYVVLRHNQGNTLRAELEAFRDLIRRTIEKKSPGTEGRIIQAMILGSQKAIPRETMEKFNRTGLTHIIAISGFNIGIVAAFALFMARLFLRAEYLLLRGNVAKLSAILAIFVVIFYTGVAGAGISVLRAAIMFTVFLTALLMDREKDLFNILAFAAFIILIVAPYSLFDVSFQLSFSAVAALIFFMPPIIRLLPPPPKREDIATFKTELTFYTKIALRGVVLFFFASLAATLGTLPLIIFYFSRIPLVGLAANMICVPILGVLAIPVSLAIVVTAPLSSALSGLVVGVTEALVRISLFFVDRFAALPWASLLVATPSVGEVAAWYLLLAWAGLALHVLSRTVVIKKHSAGRFFFFTTPFAVMLFFAATWHYQHIRETGQATLSVTAIDVGQGNSILVQFPGGKNMLVDGGGFFDGSFDIGKLVVAPYLLHEGITKIDVVALTHPDSDHLNGLLYILENFHVREVWSNGDAASTEPYRAFVEIIRKKGIPHRILSARQQEIDISGVRIQIMNPENLLHLKKALSPQNQAEEEKRSDGTNDRALTMKLSLGKRSFLLPSDISQTVESRLGETHADLRSDVLIVPHHGSRLSSSQVFLEEVAPRIAIVSCGYKNVFRFPHTETLHRYRLMNIDLYRTDLDGAVRATTDGRNISVDCPCFGSCEERL